MPGGEIITEVNPFGSAGPDSSEGGDSLPSLAFKFSVILNTVKNPAKTTLCFSKEPDYSSASLLRMTDKKSLTLSCHREGVLYSLPVCGILPDASGSQRQRGGSLLYVILRPIFTRIAKPTLPIPHAHTQ
jgi:hypothetical protein